MKLTFLIFFSILSINLAQAHETVKCEVFERCVVINVKECFDHRIVRRITPEYRTAKVNTSLVEKKKCVTHTGKVRFLDKKHPSINTLYMGTNYRNQSKEDFLVECKQFIDNANNGTLLTMADGQSYFTCH